MKRLISATFFLFSSSAVPDAVWQTMVLPVHVHLVRSVTEPQFHSGMVERDFEAVLAEVNRIWGAAGIRFALVGVTEMNAIDVAPKRLFQRSRNWVKAALPPAELVAGRLDVCVVHEMGPNGFFYGEPVVVSETAKSSRVRGGSENTIGRVLAHEFGHVLSLEHCKDRDGLMAPGLNGILLKNDEIQAARRRASELLLHGIP